MWAAGERLLAEVARGRGALTMIAAAVRSGSEPHRCDLVTCAEPRGWRVTPPQRLGPLEGAKSKRPRIGHNRNS
jgi:hypothetical protein